MSQATAALLRYPYHTGTEVQKMSNLLQILIRICMLEEIQWKIYLKNVQNQRTFYSILSQNFLALHHFKIDEETFLDFYPSVHTQLSEIDF